MSFPSFDANQGQPAQFSDNNGAQVPAQGLQQPLLAQQPLAQPQQGQEQDSAVPFQGQGESIAPTNTGGNDAKTTLW